MSTKNESSYSHFLELYNVQKMQLYGMAITSFILTAECERLVPSYSHYVVLYMSKKCVNIYFLVTLRKPMNV